MIYDFPDGTLPIRQGDIFVGVPRIELSLRRIPLVTEDERQREVRWSEVAEEGNPITAIVGIRPVTAIVATQDCDVLHSPNITLCEVARFQDVERKSAQTTSPKGWRNIITQHARINQKWFYLPPDDRIGFVEKMAVDFRVTLCLRREELEELRSLRKGRLNDLADEHFRERIGEFFRRYPYDEWYPLSPEEMASYRQDFQDAEPFPWQRTTANEGEKSS